MDKEALILHLISEMEADLKRLRGLMGSGEAVQTPVKRAEMALPAVFEGFWVLYPRKVGKMAAFRAWNTHVAKGHGDAVNEALAKQLGQADWVKEGGKYIPHPATWLNQHRWLDEVKGGTNDTGKYGGVSETL